MRSNAAHPCSQASLIPRPRSNRPVSDGHSDDPRRSTRADFAGFSLYDPFPSDRNPSQRGRASAEMADDLEQYILRLRASVSLSSVRSRRYSDPVSATMLMTGIVVSEFAKVLGPAKLRFVIHDVMKIDLNS